MQKRILIAILLPLLGLMLALAAKPLLLGDWTMFFGIFIAFTLPLTWLATTDGE
jgi:hypothetical protein